MKGQQGVKRGSGQQQAMGSRAKSRKAGSRDKTAGSREQGVGAGCKHTLPHTHRDTYTHTHRVTPTLA